MKKTFIVGIVTMVFCLTANAQYIIKTPEELVNLKKLPQEKTYVDHTGPVLFSGEYLYYALYCFNAQNNKLSNISKIGYVELVNEAKEKVFEHKIRLEKGLGKGDFFISTHIPSGKYKILAYTQWMKNGGLEQVYKDDIVIINPYLVDQSALLKNNPPIIEADAGTRKQLMSSEIDSATISFSMDKTNYTLREKVRLSIKNFKGPLGNGTYTVKVKKKDGLSLAPYLNAIDYARDYLNVDKQIKQNVGDSLFLPEQRGELFYGAVMDSMSKTPIKDAPVVISIPGAEFLLKFSQTDENGNFYSYLRKNYKNALAVVQVVEEGKSYSISKGGVKNLDLAGLEFSDFELSKDYEDLIKERSIINQIENQFFTIKPDSILLGDPIDPFDGGLPEVIKLDEYTRFPTLEETLVEVVKFAGYRSGGNENDYIKISQEFELQNEEYVSFPAIVVIDGVFILNHEKIRKFDARRIEKISLIRDQFRLGGQDYQGIMSIETFDADYLETHSAKNNLVVEFDAPVAKKNYYTQLYSEEEEFSRIPDYRSLLFWKPQFTIDSSAYDFEFYTSDIEGEYEIFLNGFTSYGKPISVTKSINVSKRPF